MWQPRIEFTFRIFDFNHLTIKANTILGKIKWANGNRYEGQWAQNKIQGKGKFITADKEIYEGEFKDNKRHGFGMMSQ